MNVVLIGYRGTGKTTTARLLAERLGWDWVDADVELESRAGKSIAAIFADEGETHFRDLESAVLVDLLRRDRTVIACGGGVVGREANRALLREHGRVVWLVASPEVLYERITADASTAGRRPNLTAQGGLDEVRRLLTRRAPWYRECADVEIDAETRTPPQIVDAVVAALRLEAPKEPS